MISEEECNMPDTKSRPQMNMKTLQIGPVVRMAFGLFLVTFGIAFYLVYYQLALQYLVENHLVVLKRGSLYHHLWTRGTPLKTKIYIFELTNGVGFLRGQKPVLREHGPFVFDVKKIRNNVTWFDNERKVSYYEKTVFHFDRQSSVADLKDYKINVINLPFVAIMNQMLKVMEKSSILNLLSPIVNTIMRNIMSDYDETLFERRTPYEIIVGRKIAMFESLEALLKPIASFSNGIAKSLKKMPKKIGYLSQRNNTFRGPIVMHTGERNFKDLLYEFDAYWGKDNLLLNAVHSVFGIERKQVIEPDNSLVRTPNHFEIGDPLLKRKPIEFYSIRRKKFNSFYAASSCNKIQGTDGTAHDNLLVRSGHNLQIYIDVCRSMDLVHKQQVYFSNFIPIEQYTFDPYSFSMTKQENWCYCRDFRSTFRSQSQHDYVNFIEQPKLLSTSTTTERTPRISRFDDDSSEEVDDDDSAERRSVFRGRSPTRKPATTMDIDGDLCAKLNVRGLSHSECRRLWIDKTLSATDEQRFQQRKRLSKRSLPPPRTQSVVASNSTALPKATIKHPILSRCDGYHDIEGCFDAPILITFPHFLYSSRFRLMIQSGIEPNVEKHGSTFNVEPVTGLSVGGRAKLQLNLRLNPSTSITGYDKFRATMMPFVWFAEGGEAQPRQKILLTIFLSTLYALQYIMLVFSLWGIIVIAKAFKALLSSQQKTLDDTNSLKLKQKALPIKQKSYLETKVKETKPKSSKESNLGYLKTTVLNPNQVACIRNHMGADHGKASQYPALREGEERKFAQLTPGDNKSRQSTSVSMHSSMAPIE